MADDIIIRAAQFADIEAIEYIIEAGYRTEEAREGWTHETDLLAGNRLSDGEIASTLKDINSKMFVACDIESNKIWGVICVTRDNGVFEFGKFAVRPNLQGKGIGRKLIKHVEDFIASNWNAKVLQLSVLICRKELVDFYYRCGFVDTGKRIDFVEMHPYVTLREGAPHLELMIMEKPVN